MDTENQLTTERLLTLVRNKLNASPKGIEQYGDREMKLFQIMVDLAIHTETMKLHERANSSTG